jgi:NAD(P)H-dependent FMN reductase
MTATYRLLLVSGSLRSASTNSAVLRTAVEVASPEIAASLYDGMGDLPHFNPDDDADPLPQPVARLRSAIAAADGLLFSTPEYAGALPGSFKNLLDWTVGGIEMTDKPVAWIKAAAPGRGLAAHAELRTVLGYVTARIVEDACADIPITNAAVGPEGTIADPEVRARIAGVIRALRDGGPTVGP